MALVDDVIIGLSAAIATFSLVILLSFLSKYRTAANEVNKSAELAKNIYDSMNSRLTIQDTRIVDLMARLEVLSARQTSGVMSPPRKVTTSPEPLSRASQETPQVSQPFSSPQSPMARIDQSGKPTNDTKLAILRTLMDGPKSSIQIREVIQVTREHNGRLLKELYEKGLVTRKAEHKPFLYEISESGRRFIGS